MEHDGAKPKAGLLGNASRASIPRAPDSVPAPLRSHTWPFPSHLGRIEAKVKNSSMHDLSQPVKHSERPKVTKPVEVRSKMQTCRSADSKSPACTHTQPRVYLLCTELAHVSEAVWGELAEFSGNLTIHRASLKQIKEVSHSHHPPQGGGLRAQDSADGAQHKM